MEPLDPYEPPSPALTLATRPQPRRSRWAYFRWIPVVYFGLFAVVGPIGALGNLVRFALMMSRPPGTGIAGSPTPLGLIAQTAGYGVLGGLAFATARAWYRYRWRWAVVLSIFFFVALVLASLVAPRTGFARRRPDAFGQVPAARSALAPPKVPQ